MTCTRFTSKTNWEGLWYHPESHSYSSAVLNLAALKDFKGCCRMKVIKNRFKKKGDNKPNYLFTIASVDKDADDIQPVGIKNDEEMFTYSEVYRLIRRCIDESYSDFKSGYSNHDLIPEDYLHDLSYFLERKVRG